MTARFKTCKHCNERFPVQPHHPAFQNWCSIDCGIALSRAKQAKTHWKAHRAKKKSLKDNDRVLQLKAAQREFNRFIRLRDKHEPCISCNRHHDGQYHCGHYKTLGSHPELRFSEWNCAKQCAPCNNHRSGDIVNFRQGLLKKIGPEKLEWLEGPHDRLKLTLDEIKAIRQKYKAKADELEHSG